MQIIRNPQKNEDESELVEQAIASDQQALRQTLEALPDWARAATERRRILAESSEVSCGLGFPLSKTGLRFEPADPGVVGIDRTMMAVAGWLLERSMIVPSHEGAGGSRPRTVDGGGAYGADRRAVSAGSGRAAGPGDGSGFTRLNILPLAKKEPAMRIRLLRCIRAFIFLVVHTCSRSPRRRTAQRRGPKPRRLSPERLEQEAAFVYRGELGKWWQNSDIAKKLQLSDGQIAQLDQTFYDHKLS